MGNADKFWKAHSRTKPGGDAFFSADFRNLMEGMWTLDPNLRFKMD